LVWRTLRIVPWPARRSPPVWPSHRFGIHLCGRRVVGICTKSICRECRLPPETRQTSPTPTPPAQRQGDRAIAIGPPEQPSARPGDPRVTKSACAARHHPSRGIPLANRPAARSFEGARPTAGRTCGTSQQNNSPPPTRVFPSTTRQHLARNEASNPRSSRMS